jgi:LuxR family maltose regulon positive regulatory protein
MERQRVVASPEGADQVESSAPAPGAKVPRAVIVCGRRHGEVLAAGRSNQAIARELVVTLDTIKKHVGHVLGKLGAANRTEAVARARELSLIP